MRFVHCVDIPGPNDPSGRFRISMSFPGLPKSTMGTWAMRNGDFFCSWWLSRYANFRRAPPSISIFGIPPYLAFYALSVATAWACVLVFRLRRIVVATSPRVPLLFLRFRAVLSGRPDAIATPSRAPPTRMFLPKRPK